MCLFNAIAQRDENLLSRNFVGRLLEADRYVIGAQFFCFCSKRDLHNNCLRPKSEESPIKGSLINAEETETVC